MRMITCLMDSLEKRVSRVVSFNVNTDFVVSLISMKCMKSTWQLAFGQLMVLASISTIITLCRNLEKVKSCSSPPLHAFTGCDSVSFFSSKTKKSKQS